VVNRTRVAAKPSAISQRPTGEPLFLAQRREGTKKVREEAAEVF
jgi:hypothetical protein